MAAESDGPELLSATASDANNTAGKTVKLKWLPADPAAADRTVDKNVRAVQYTTVPSPPSPPSPLPGSGASARRTGVRMAQVPASSTVKNPYANSGVKGGQESVPASPAPPETIGDDMRLPTADEPKADRYLQNEPGKVGTSSKKTESRQSGADQEIVSKHHELDETCPSVKDLKGIHELTTDLTPEPGEVPRQCPLTTEPFKRRAWDSTTYTWTASALCHKPLYFDDMQLERYGHSCGPLLQPFMSGARFFGTVFILPYEMGVETPNECIYALGDDRPGDCTPYTLDPFPLSLRGALYEAGAWTGGVFLFH
jgi:hypothetical protein